MKFGLTLFVALATAMGAVSISRAASQPMFKIDAQIVGPAGQNWGQHAMTASQGKISWVKFRRGQDAFRLGITVSEELAPNCHLLGIRLGHTEGVDSATPHEKELMLQTEACAGQSVKFDGTPLGGPRLQIALAKSLR